MSEYGISSLVFDGTLELCDPAGLQSSTDYWFESLADGAAWGDPQPVEVTLNSLMRDGAIVATTGDQNREASFQVRVCGVDSASLDAGVQALQLATRKRTTLVWTPPDNYCEPRVWDVETSNLLEPNGFDDRAYMIRNQQVFRLRLVCQPYRRSAIETVDDAGTPPSGGGTLLYACESTTGWTSVDSGTPDITVDSVIYSQGTGSIKARFLASAWDQGFDSHFASGTSTHQVTGLSLSTATGGYLSVSVRLEFEDNISGTTPGLLAAAMQVGGVWVDAPTPLAVSRDANGFIHYVWPVDASLTITGLRFATYQAKAAQFVSAPYTWYDDVELLPSATTDHQIVKQHDVQGSARTAGSIQISAASEVTALGEVLVITTPTDAVPAGFQPDGLRWLTVGTPTADATALGGNYYTPNTTDYTTGAGRPVMDVPVSMLTNSAYTMVALVKVETMPLVAGVQAQLLVDGTLVGPTSTAEVSIPDITTGWHFVPLGAAMLPPRPVQNADDTTKVRLTFKGAKLANVYMIPAWQVNGWPVAEFSIVDCGTGTVGPHGASSSLFIDSPSVTQPNGGWWRGPTTDRANAQSARDLETLKKPGTHYFLPGSLTNFVVSLGAAGPTSTLIYYARHL